MVENSQINPGFETGPLHRRPLVRRLKARRLDTFDGEVPNLSVVTTRLRRLYGLSESDQAAFERLPMKAALVDERHTIVWAGGQIDRCAIILAGMAFGYKMTGDGQRQILSLHFAGDLPNLDSLHSGTIDTNVAAATPCRVGYVARDALLDLCWRHPTVAMALWCETLSQASIVREWLLNMGRREARPRLAHFLSEVLLRQRANGLASSGSFVFPLTQVALADILGLSPVHINRLIQGLRRDGLIERRGTSFEVLDWERLQVIADFDPAYLRLDP